MTLGPLEYIIIGCPGNSFSSHVAPELHAIQEKEFLRVVDMLFLRKEADGTVTILEVQDLDEHELESYGVLKSNLLGLITHEDILTLSQTIPAETSAVVVLLEHLWISRLQQAIKRADGVVFVGGMVQQDIHAEVEQELVKAQQQQASYQDK
jgi:uncharacterized membrane protein